MYFSFEERTVNILSDFVLKNSEKTSIERSPTSVISNNQEIIPSKDDLDIPLKNLLTKLYSNQSSVCNGECEMTINENGEVKIFYKVHLNAVTNIYNLRVNVFAEHKVKIKKVIACDLLTGNPFAIYPCEVNEYSFLGFAILPEVVLPGNNYAYYFEVIIDDYFKDLFVKHVCHEQRFIISNKYKTARDIFKFENCDLFQSVAITVTKHPNSLLIGKELSYSVIDNHIVFDILNDNLFDAKSVIEYKISI